MSQLDVSCDPLSGTKNGMDLPGNLGISVRILGDTGECIYDSATHLENGSAL
jgi:hypothetical protein